MLNHLLQASPWTIIAYFTESGQGDVELSQNQGLITFMEGNVGVGK